MDTDTNKSLSANEFCWEEVRAPASHDYLGPTVMDWLDEVSRVRGKPLRVLDLGCGNGAFSEKIYSNGFEVAACDHSRSGIEIAKEQHPQINFFQQDIAESLSDEMKGAFDIVVSLEVIEHLFQPRILFDRAREALGQDGVLIVSTPYHGYLKNLVLALINKFDDHWHPLRDFGHIKFFSKRTLLQCADECGFKTRKFKRVGRFSVLAKSMIIMSELRR